MKMGNIKFESASETTKIERKKMWFVFPKFIYCRCGQIGEKVSVSQIGNELRRYSDTL